MKPKVVVVIAIVLGLITSVLVYTMLGTPQQQEQEKEELVTVIAAQDSISPRQKITSEMIKTKKIPARQAHPEALKSLDEVKGRYASAEIVAEEQILKSRLYSEEAISSAMSFKLDAKKRAVTVAVNEVTGVGGFLTPGDHVDVVSVFSGVEDTLAKTILQNVKVLAVAQDMDTDQNREPKVQKSVTLAVGSEEAEKLVLADREGAIRLALRSPKNQIQEGTSGLNLNKLTGQPSSEQDTEQEEQKTKKEAVDKQSKEKKSSQQQKKNTPQKETKQETKEQEDISKTIEIIKGTEKDYEQILIKPKEEK